MNTYAKIHGFPRSALIGAGSVMLMSMVLAGVGHLSGIANDTPVSAPIVARDLFFHDQQDGSIQVFDARHLQTPIDIVAPETNGFLRATLRGLAQQRRRQDEGPQTPFRLTEWADGRLTLEDPVTHRKVEMEAFGITNESAFAQLLTVKEPQ
jgi:putative photosynthetic complex assembly protein